MQPKFTRVGGRHSYEIMWIASKALCAVRRVQASGVHSGLQCSCSLRLASIRPQLIAEGANPDGNRH